MTRYTVVGDPHAKLDNLDKQKALTEIVEARGKPVIWLGDILDTKEIIRGKCLNFWYEYFRKSELQHIVLVGNHDWFNLECEDHSLRVLEELPNVDVVDRLDIEGSALKKVAYLPYLHDPEKIKAVLDSIPDNYVLFAHLELSDFDFGNGHTCESGLTFDYFKRFKRVITGHFHKYQQKGNVTYLGTPFSLNFGETNQTKYLAEYDFDADTLDLIETNFPRHMTYQIDCANPFDFDTLKADDYNRVILEGTQEQIQTFDKAKLLENAKVITKASDQASLDVEIEETATNTQQFKSWAANVKHLDPDTTTLGMEILGEVNAS